ncbi:MAG TPA: MFS transporter [Acidothermaceae bacterium]|nr:MFS transporter [Acidothermaceae bacterium]
MSEPRTTERGDRESVGRAAVHVLAVAGGSAGRWFTRSTRAEGADASGLASLIDLHAIQSAGDALLTVALANTLFFSVAVDQARTKVALYLLITMAPFALIAPVIGPLLDRFRNGRRYALAATLILRAFLAWVMAGAVGKHGGFALYPAAFGALVCSKAYGVSRSAVVPRVLPPNVTLVRGNSRLTLWGVLSATIAAPIGQALSWATGTPSWTLRLCAVVYLAGSVFAFKLPERVDSSEGEVRLRRRTRRANQARPSGESPHRDAAVTRSAYRRILPPLRGIGPRMTTMLRAGAGLRAFTGFLTLFLAFLIRKHPLGVFHPNADLGVIVACAALGSVLGTTLGGWLKPRQPEILAIVSLFAASVIGIVTAVWFNLLTAALAILIANISQSLSKLGLDSVIQRDAVEHVRTSAFARSETVLQLSWVLGGFVAILLPSNGSLGLTLGSAVLVVVLLSTMKAVRTRVSPDRGIELLRERRKPVASDT